MTKQIEVIRCEHISGPGTGEFALHLGNVRMVIICKTCYDALVGSIMVDVISKAIQSRIVITAPTPVTHLNLSWTSPIPRTNAIADLQDKLCGQRGLR